MNKKSILKYFTAAVELEMRNHDIKFTQITPHDVQEQFAYYFLFKGAQKSDYVCQPMCTFSPKNNSINFCAGNCNEAKRAE